MKNIYTIALLFIGLIAFTSATPIKTKPNEAVIFGRFVLDTKTIINTKKLELNLLLSPKGKAKIKVDENGFFAINIKEGYSLVDFIKYGEGGNFQKRLYNGCLSVSVPEAGKAYYVGDIYMNWTPTERDKVTKGFSIGIGFGGSHVGGGVAVPIGESYTPGQDCPEITIKETQQTIDLFQSTYPQDKREIAIQFMDLN